MLAMLAMSEDRFMKCQSPLSRPIFDPHVGPEKWANGACKMECAAIGRCGPCYHTYTQFFEVLFNWELQQIFYFLHVSHNETC